MMKISQGIIKQGIAFLLCLVMLLSIMPAIMATAAPITEGELGNFKGLIFEYSTTESTKGENKELIKISASVYGITQGVESFAFNIGYDETIFTPARHDFGAIVDRNGFANVAVIPGLIPESMTINDTYEDVKGKPITPFALTMLSTQPVVIAGEMTDVPGTIRVNMTIPASSAKLTRDESSILFTSTEKILLCEIYLAALNEEKTDTLVEFPEDLDFSGFHLASCADYPNGFKIASKGNVSVGDTPLWLGFPSGDPVEPGETTKVTLTAQADDGAAINKDAYIVVDKNPDGYVDPATAAMLSMAQGVDEDGKASFDLPDGDYTYKIVSAGNEDVMGTFSVRDGVVTMNPTNLSDTELTTSPGGSTAESGAITPKDADPIVDRLYYVVGTLVPEENPTQMKLDVFIKNANSLAGTFGLKYDTELFTYNKVEYVDDGSDDSIVVNPNITLFDPSGSVANPTLATGYHSFYWEYPWKEHGTLDSRSNEIPIATYTLDLTTKAKTADNYAKLIHDKSITVMPYYRTASGKAIMQNYNALGMDKDFEFMQQYWRDTDAANNPPTDGGQYRYDVSKATGGGFHQVSEFNDDALPGDEMRGSDIRTQFVYNFEGNTSVSFLVTDEEGNPLKDIVVVIPNPDDPEHPYTGKTDEYGEVDIGLPGDGDYTYEIDAPGFEREDGPVDMDDVNVVELKELDGYPVKINDHDPDQTELISLVGPDSTKSGEDYVFNLVPKPGYAWENDKAPSPDEIVLAFFDGTNLTTLDTSDGKLYWDGSLNAYVLKKEAITGGNPTDSIYISVLDGIVEVGTEGSKAPNIYVSAGTGGDFYYELPTDPARTKNSTYDPTTAPGAKTNKLTETLGDGQSTSALYTFSPDTSGDKQYAEPKAELSTPRKDRTELYEGYVIDKFLVNGVEIGLTDEQRIFGVEDYQLVGISEDQTITVTYRWAVIDPHDPDTTGDDEIDPDPLVPPTGPKSDAVVSLTVGQYGEAKATTTDVTDDKVIGYSRKNYDVATGNFVADITAYQTVLQPDTTSRAYVIDLVVVNGDIIYNSATDSLTGGAGGINNKTGITFVGGDANAVDGANGYGYQTGKLTIDESALGDGKVYSVVVTFRPAKKNTTDQPADPIFTIVQLVKKAGEGTAEPNNPGNKVEGPFVTYEFTPAPGYKMGETTFKKISAPMPADVEYGFVDGTTIYEIDNLSGGVYMLEYEFVEILYTVDFMVFYGTLKGTVATPIATSTKHATFSFIRTSGGTSYYPAAPTGTITNGVVNYQFELPMGTWTVKVTKNGLLDYEVTGFVIDVNGDANLNTYKNGDGILFFGRTTEATDDQRPINPIIGDSTWDGKLIAANDIAQVANGFTASGTYAKERADLDEDTNIEYDDVTLVTGALGRRNTVITYTAFMGTTPMDDYN